MKKGKEDEEKQQQQGAGGLLATGGSEEEGEADAGIFYCPRLAPPLIKTWLRPWM